MKKSIAFDNDVYLLFVDFIQAYDSIIGSKLRNVMVKLGIPNKIVRIVKTCMQNSWCKIKFNTKISEEFIVTTGIRQGDALPSTLFNFALESFVREVLKSKPSGLNTRQGKQIILTANVDDIIVESEGNFKRISVKLIYAVKNIRFVINENKSKIMIISRKNHLQTKIRV